MENETETETEPTRENPVKRVTSQLAVFVTVSGTVGHAPCLIKINEMLKML